MTPLLQVEKVTKCYGARIDCTDVSFDLYPGEVMGIVGESGSGKSTLLNCLAGHLTPDHGAVRFDTRTDGLRDTTTTSEPERRMLGRTDWAFVHQHAHDGLRMNVSAGGNVGERLMADRLMVMKDGRVIETELTDQVLDDPQHAYTQLFVSSVLQV